MVLHSDNKLVELESETYSAVGLDDSLGIVGNPRVLSLLSSILERSIQKNESSLKVSRKQEVVTIFRGTRAPPSMSIGQYIERIFKYSTCSPCCLVLAYVYTNRYLQRIDGSLTSLVVHRLLITSIMVAAKCIDDE
ncbi:hypothetical protein LWI29_010643 [Acer saccharum]|uniref:Cyclin n=1 Tax=Acer saccharum TaxID=4024 RepID=A0AA39SX73_ACESA|nr:hypothetical protein LWI29_010643 [Acer saccharum]